MKWKVCGMKFPENILEVSVLQPDFMGFIFYPPSSRYVEKLDNKRVILNLDPGIKKVGVFVNPLKDTVLEKVDEYKLDYVQLHGGESPEFCDMIRSKQLGVIKVFSVHDTLDHKKIRQFDDVADYYLFDTRTKKFGGSGKHFNWEILNEYDTDNAFFISGGIETIDLSEIKEKNWPKFMGIDVNSRFEFNPGLKNVFELKELKEAILKI